MNNSENIYSQRMRKDLQLEGSKFDVDKSISVEVDVDFYVNLYPDLIINGISTQDEAINHYNEYGHTEGRFSSIYTWASAHDLPLDLIPNHFSFEEIISINVTRRIFLEPQNILDALLGKLETPINFSRSDHKTAEIYNKLGEHYLRAGKLERSRTLLRSGITFERTSKAFELLGNIHLKEEPIIALEYYKASMQIPGHSTTWLIVNYAKCLRALCKFEDSFYFLSQNLCAGTDFHYIVEEFESIIDHNWRILENKLLVDIELGVIREQAIKEISNFYFSAYNAFYNLFRNSNDLKEVSINYQTQPDLVTPVNLPALGPLNLDRILIIGDFHIPQCAHYRIHQKIEQLESVGKSVVAIDWRDAKKYSEEISFYDVVIFYRTPLNSSLVKIAAMINATGKLSLFEIDDLIFTSDYPPPINSYGGYVSLQSYCRLNIDMALFNTAARLCRIGIASTEPLAKKLKLLVQDKDCFVHRNGLDQFNYFSSLDKTKKATVDIFYGSGTYSHNSDFIEQALPSIELIFQEFSNVRLIIMGYLRLPYSFKARFERQFIEIPFSKDLEAYWSYLEQADINIAVLNDDLLNGCKSEIKWLEAASFAVPSVVSATENYIDVVRDGVDALLVRSSDEWYSALKRLILDSSLRISIGNAALNRIKEQYLPQALGKSFSEKINTVGEYKGLHKSKLALVNVFFPPQSIGGATRVIADNFKYLKKNHSDNFDICIFSSDQRNDGPYQVSTQMYQGSRVYRSTTMHRENMDWYERDPEIYRIFMAFLKLEKPDLIHFHCVQRLTASVVEAALDSKIPFIVTAHDAWWISDFQFLVDANGVVHYDGHPDSYLPFALPPNISLSDSIKRRHYLKYLLGRASQLLTVSDNFAEIYKKNGLPNAKVIKNGISDEINWGKKNTSHTEKIICGHVGGMSRHKGYDILKEAVLEMQPQNIEFLIVDHSKEEDYKFATFWGNVPVTYIGRVSQEKVVNLYQRMDVLFAPSIWPESFGLVTREALACNCWVVTSNIGGIGEDVVDEKNGILIEPNVNGISNALLTISKNKKVFKSPAPRNKVYKSSNQGKALYKLYKELLLQEQSQDVC